MTFNVNKSFLSSPSELFQKPIINNNNPDNHTKNSNIKLTGLKINNDKASFSQVNTGKIPTSQTLNLIDSKNNSDINPKTNLFKNATSLNNISLGTPNTSSTNKLAGIPPRSANAMTGSQFIETTKNMSRADREKMILKEINSGNIPDFVRELKQISISITDKQGIKHTAKISVTPDYLAIGSNNDFIRIPMDPITAQKIADKTKTILPTRKMVDDIYKSADAKMNPQPLPAGSEMMSNQYYDKHNQMVESQIIDKGFARNQLIVGHQKDIVITNKLDNKPTQVAIYGWHQNNGKTIQPLSTIHENTYADYSHGVRLISDSIIVDGQKMSIKDVLAHPELSKLLSDEGVINNTRASRP